jgi:DNA-binding NarL/FixJ family response regulator
MDPIRVVIVETPDMLADVIAKVLGPHRDMEIVRATHADDLLETIQRVDPDVLVLSSEDRELMSQAFSVRPRLKVLAVAHEGRTAFLHELRPVAASIRYITPHDLVEVIHTAGMRVRGEASVAQ